MDSCKDTCGFHRWVSPFRNLRITACLRLPEAYRSLPRLSSALSAKASALRPSLLNLLYSPQNDKSFCMLHSHHKQSSVVVHDYNCLSIFRSTTYHCFGKQQSHFALTSKTDLVVSMFACFCIRFSRYRNPLLCNGLQTNVCLSTFISHQKPKLSFRSLITYESE